MGRLSRPVAPEFLAWLAVPPGRPLARRRQRHRRAHRGGARRLARRQQVRRRRAAPTPSAATPRRPCPTRGRPSGAGDARALPVDDGGVRRRGRRRWCSTSSPTSRPRWPRCAAPRGPAAPSPPTSGTTPAACSCMRTFWDAAVALDPAASACTRRARFAFCRPEPLRALFAGRRARRGRRRGDRRPDRLRRTSTTTGRRFLAGTGPAPAYVAGLPDEDDRAALREAVRRPAAHPADDGSISLTARAWAVRGCSGPEPAVSAPRPGSPPPWQRRSSSTWTRSCSAGTRRRSSCTAGSGRRRAGVRSCCWRLAAAGSRRPSRRSARWPPGS